jgi:hypothetical protein
MRAFRCAGLWLVPGIVALVAPTPSAAQQRSAIGAVGYFVEQGSTSENASQSGTWVGVEGRVPAGRVLFAARYMAGPLEGNPARVDRAARETQLTIGYRAGRWLTIGAQAKATVIESDLSNSVARMYGVAAAFGSGLGVTGLRARAEVAIYPLSSVVAARELGLPRQVEVGVTYRPSGLPAEVYLSYLMENIDFKDAADLRLGGPLLSVRLGR